MEIDLCWWDDDYLGKKEFYETTSTENLIAIAKDGNYLQDVPPALGVLYERDSEKAMALARAIVEEKKGDRFLREWAADFLADND
jgi:hypothetical protein